jgi:hypothetical protein
MSRDNRKEFPYLSDEAFAAYRAAFPCAVDPFMDHDNRRNLSAFLQEAMKQVEKGYRIPWERWRSLEFIANNLHSPPPPPPTLAQAREADLESPAGRDLVRDFLASVREVDQ